MNHAIQTLAAAVALLALTLAPAAWANAGKVLLVTGQATATNEAGITRSLRKGDTVSQGDTINTARFSYANIEFTDSGRTLIGPNSAFKIEQYTHDRPAAGGPRRRSAVGRTDSNAVFRLLRGGFRAITGLIGQTSPDRYTVQTPVATIGIRGTDFIATVCDADCDLGPGAEGKDPSGGTVAGVYDGGISVSNAAGDRKDLDTDQFLLVTRSGEMVRLPVPPEFLLLSPLDDPAECE